jgi:sedoheptulose-bisphosphatase
LGCHDPYPWQESRDESEPERTDAKVTVTEDIREWDYGDYEGITSKEIQEDRKAAGLSPWDIWRDGCPGGEYDVFSCEPCSKRIADHLWFG